jgi:hypothetical protein
VAISFPPGVDATHGIAFLMPLWGGETRPVSNSGFSAAQQAAVARSNRLDAAEFFIESPHRLRIAE